MRVLDYSEYRRTCALMRALEGGHFQEDLIRTAETPYWCASTWAEYPADVAEATLLKWVRLGTTPASFVHVFGRENTVSVHLLVRGEITLRETAIPAEATAQ